MDKLIEKIIRNQKNLIDLNIEFDRGFEKEQFYKIMGLLKNVKKETYSFIPSLELLLK